MRTLATLLNICLLLLLSFMLFDKGAPSGDELLPVLLAFAAPIASLIAIYQGRGKYSTGLLSLYLERKRLEEQQRIDKLRSRSDA